MCIRDRLISDALGTVRVTLTENVYPMLDTMLNNLQDSLGAVSYTHLDDAANSKRGEDIMISTPDSKVKVFVIPTNEELVIARDTRDIVG